ncbi:MAG: YkgJ family cysteine cluster protein [Desulfovibrio sp.]|nr:YkgJ family cysteine cluster protein [Desulfovibrio sp.]
MPLIWPAEARLFRHTDSWLERSYPGVDLLLDAFSVVDLGVKKATERDGRVPACHAGCAQCCMQPIPVTPLEVLGLHSYVRHRLPQASLAALVARLAVFQGHKEQMALACPFLVDGTCLVYPVRPVVCRQYMVFGRACAQGEDATRTRPREVLKPLYHYMLTALLRTLPWYVGHETSPPEHPTEEQARGFFNSVTTVIQLVAWNRLFRV